MTTAGEVIRRLRARGLTLGTCESLTGGGVVQLLTEVAGASAVVRGGLVTYASDLKASLAGVDAAHIARHGVINEVTARQMALGAQRVLGVDIAVACTGVAGPDPQDGEAPGTVWIAMAGPGPERVEARLLALDGDRARIRRQTADAVFALILEGLENVAASEHH